MKGVVFMVDKMAIASIIQNNGGQITTETLIDTLKTEYHLDDETATNVAEEFKSCRLVKFENNTFSFA